MTSVRRRLAYGGRSRPLLVFDTANGIGPLFRKPLPRNWFVVRYLPEAIPNFWIYHQDIGTHVTRYGSHTRFFE